MPSEDSMVHLRDFNAPFGNNGATYKGVIVTTAHLSKSKKYFITESLGALRFISVVGTRPLWAKGRLILYSYHKNRSIFSLFLQWRKGQSRCLIIMWQWVGSVTERLRTYLKISKGLWGGELGTSGEAACSRDLANRAMFRTSIAELEHQYRSLELNVIGAYQSIFQVFWKLPDGRMSIVDKIFPGKFKASCKHFLLGVGKETLTLYWTSDSEELCDFPLKLRISGPDAHFYRFFMGVKEVWLSLFLVIFRSWRGLQLRTSW